MQKSKSKYRNIPTERTTITGKVIKFHSKKEAERYDHLMILLKAFEIKNLKLQPAFTLSESYTTPHGDKVGSIVYKADFSYERKRKKYKMYKDPHGVTRTSAEYEEIWEYIVEDVKGGRATQTADYKMKKKLMVEKFNIMIAEV